MRRDLGIWTQAGSGNASTTTATFDAATIAVPGSAINSVTVTWAAQASLNPTSASNSEITYAVERKLGSGGTWTAIGSGGCSGTKSYGTTSCVDTPASAGGYNYRAIASFRSWTATSATAGPITFTIDTTAPTVSAQLTPAPNGAGWNNTSPVAVDLSASDGGGSGIGSLKHTTDGSDPTVSGTATVYTTSLSIAATTTVKYFATDLAGNASTVSTQLVKVDTTAPGAPSVGFSALTNAYASGTTLFYRSNASSGAFTVTASATDANSGVATYAFPTLPAGWSATAGAFGVNTYSWIAANPTAPSGAQNVSATNNASLTSAATSITMTSDNAAPTGSVTYTDGYYTSASIGVTFSASDGSGSGVNASSGLLQRAEATLTNGTCVGTYTFATLPAGTNPSSPFTDTTVASGKCYQYRYLVSDNLGIQGTITSANVAKVDTTPPGAPTLGFSALTNTYGSGTTLFYRSNAGSGAFTVTASATDADTGIASYAFPTLPAGWNSSAGALGVRTYSWSVANPTAPSGAQNITATNNAALTSDATGITLTADNAAPTGSVAYTDGFYTATSITVSLNPSDGSGSGVKLSSGLLQRADAAWTPSTGLCGPFSGFATVTGGTSPGASFADATVINNRCYKYQYLVSDNLGMQGTISSANIAKVDTTAPTAPSAPVVTSATAAWGSSPACGVTGTRYVNAATQGAVVITAMIPAADAGTAVLFSATSAAPSPVTVTDSFAPATGATTSTTTLDLSSASFGEGPMTVTAQIQDAAGNLSTILNPANVTVKDTVVPAAPSDARYRDNVSILLGNKDEMYGSSAECGSTIKAAQTVGGSTTFSSPPVIAAGTYSFDLTAQALTAYSYNVTQTDRAGNKSAIVVVAGGSLL